MYTLLFAAALLAISPPIRPDALLQLAEEDANVFGHLAAVIAADGNLDECCPSVDDAIANAFRSAKDENNLFIFTGDGDDEQLQILEQDSSGMFSVVFEAYLLDVQFGDAGAVADLIGDDTEAAGGVHCVAIDANTILCAWSNPNRIIILCRTGGEWKICFDSKKVKNADLR